MKLDAFWVDALPDVKQALAECVNDYKNSTVPVKFKQLWQMYVTVFTEAYGKILALDASNFWVTIGQKILSFSDSTTYDTIDKKTLGHCIDYLKFQMLALYCSHIYLKSSRADYPQWYASFIETECQKLEPRIVRKLNEFQWSLYSTHDLRTQTERYKLRQRSSPLLVSDHDFMFHPFIEQTSFVMNNQSKNVNVYLENNPSSPMWSVRPVTRTRSMTHHTVIAQQDFQHNQVLAILQPSVYTYDRNDSNVSNEVYHELPVLVRRWSFRSNNTMTGAGYVLRNYRADVTGDSKAAEDPKRKGSLIALAAESHFFGHKHKPIRAFNAKMSSAGVIYVTDPNGIKKGQEIVIHRRTELAWDCTDDAMRKYIYRLCDDNLPLDNAFFLRNAILQRKECRSDVNIDVSSLTNVGRKNTFYAPIVATMDSFWLYELFLVNVDSALHVMPIEVQNIIRAKFIYLLDFLVESEFREELQELVAWQAVYLFMRKQLKTDDNMDYLKYLEQQLVLQRKCKREELVKIEGNTEIKNMLYLLPCVDVSHPDKHVYTRNNTSVIGNTCLNPVRSCIWKGVTLPPMFIMEGFDTLAKYIKENVKDVFNVENYTDDYETKKTRLNIELFVQCDDKNMEFRRIDGDYYDLPLLSEHIVQDEKHIIVRRSSFYRKLNHHILYQMYL